MKLNRAFALGLFFLAFVFSSHAQPVNVQQFQNTQTARQLQMPLPGLSTTNAPEIYPGESADTGPQRILRLTPRPDYFSVVLDSQVFYSDNANFAEHDHRFHSSVFVNTFQVAFTPPDIQLGPGKFAPAIGYISQWYNYSSSAMEGLDFNAQTAFVSGRYTLGNWQFGLGGNYTRLVNQPNYGNQTYSEWLPALTVQRSFPVNDSLAFIIGNQVDYHFTHVPTFNSISTNSVSTNNISSSNGSGEVNNRFDEAVNLTLSWQVNRQLNVQPYCRYQYSRYRSGLGNGLDNNLYSVGITLAYYFNQNVSVRTFYNYNIKHSNDPSAAAYIESESGVGAAVNITF